MSGERPVPYGDAWPHELSEATCRRLLGENAIGRLVWHGQDGPSAQPVNYAVDGDDILVRLSPYSLAARECVGSVVAFEVDHVDPRTRRGWSVLARGLAQREPLPSSRTQVDVWPAGRRSLVLRIEVTRLTGRDLDKALLTIRTRA